MNKRTNVQPYKEREGVAPFMFLAALVYFLGEPKLVFLAPLFKPTQLSHRAPFWLSDENLQINFFQNQTFSQNV
jgi:hypothetical protein